MIIEKVGHDVTIRKAELRTRQVKSERRHAFMQCSASTNSSE